MKVPARRSTETLLDGITGQSPVLTFQPDLTLDMGERGKVGEPPLSPNGPGPRVECDPFIY